MILQDTVLERKEMLGVCRRNSRPYWQGCDCFHKNMGVGAAVEATSIGMPNWSLPESLEFGDADNDSKSGTVAWRTWLFGTNWTQEESIKDTPQGLINELASAFSPAPGVCVFESVPAYPLLPKETPGRMENSGNMHIFTGSLSNFKGPFFLM